METLNKFKSRKDWTDRIWAKLLENIKNPSLSAILNSILSSYEKRIIVNRLIALSLIKKGKTYKQIGEDLWLSPTTISSLKRILDKNSAKEYQSYRSYKNKKVKTTKIKKMIVEDSPFSDWIDHFISVFPKKHGPRWKFLR